MKYLIFSLLFVICGSSVHAQQGAFHREFKPVSGGSSPSFVTTPAGGYCMVGVSQYIPYYSGNFFMLRLRENGDTTWLREFRVEEQVSPRGISADLYNGYNVLLSGPNSSQEFTLVKADSTGSILWARTWAKQDSLFAFTLVTTADNGIGLITVENNLPKLTKVDSTGTLQWVRRLDSAFYFPYFYMWQAQGLVATADGGFAILGRGNDSLNTDIFLVKCDANGNTLWAKKYDYQNNQEECYGLSQLPDGGFMIGASVMIRTDSLGNVVSSFIPYPHAQTLTAPWPGGYFLYQPGLLTNVIKYDLAGNLVWTRSSGISHGITWNVIGLDDGTCAMLSGEDDFGNDDAILQKFDTLGHIGICHLPLTDFSISPVTVQAAAATLPTFPDSLYQVSNVIVHDTVTAKQITYVCGELQIKEQETGAELLIYPMPASDHLTIDYRCDECEYEIKLYDLTGRLVHEARGRGKTRIPVAGFRSGMHLIQVSDGMKMKSRLVSIVNGGNE